MKHLKTFESINDDLQIGDYVILKINNTFNNPLIDNNPNLIYLNSHIGNVRDIINESVRVNYDNVPNNMTHYFIKDHDKKNTYYIQTIKSLILHHSNNIEDLKIMIDADKYNL